MRKAITINIPEPCHEDWNKMTPKEQGRHCDACNKTVIDFTKKTDEQIIKTLEANGKLCGRFKTQQLNREIVLTRKDKNNYLSWVASSLFAFMALGNLEGHAQGKPKTVKVDTIKVPQVKGKIATSVINEKIISGRVTTEIDDLPLPGSSVTLKGTTKEVKTDFDGLYKIKAKIGDTLVFKYVGLFDKEVVISEISKIDVALEDSDLFDEVILGYTTTYSENVYRRKLARNAKRKAIRNGEQDRTSLGKFFYGIKSLFSKK